MLLLIGPVDYIFNPYLILINRDWRKSVNCV